MLSKLCGAFLECSHSCLMVSAVNIETAVFLRHYLYCPVSNLNEFIFLLIMQRLNFSMLPFLFTHKG